jgi:AraC-like DNA-binding protein
MARTGSSPVIVAWVTDALARQRLAAAITERLPRRAQAPALRWCDSASALLATVAQGGATATIIEIGDTVSAHVTNETTTDIAEVEELTRALRAGYPAVPVLIYAPLTAAASRAIVTLASAGITNVIIAGYDDMNHAVRPILDAAMSACIAEAAYGRLSAVASRDVTAILGYALRYATAAPSVASAAQALRVHRKTLASWCHTSGAPPPRVLVTWCRLIIAAERLAVAQWPTERVARAFGFGSGSALNRLIKRHIGLTRAGLREQGSAIVVEMLARRLEDGRRASDPVS